MKKIVIISFTLLLVLNIAGDGICEKDAVKKNRPEKPKIERERKDWTKADLIDALTYNIESETEALDFIPQIKARRSDIGKDYYVYIAGKEEKRFEDLDKDTLDKLWTRVSQTVTQIRTQRIQKQLESIRQAQVAQNAASRSVPKIPVIPAQPPKTSVTVPQVPKAPQIPQPPKK